MRATPDNGSIRADLYTNNNVGTRRLKISPGSTAFDEGREFRISWEFDVTTPEVLRFVSPVPFTLRKQQLEVDTGGIRFRVFRTATPAGTFGAAIQSTPVNSESIYPYTQQAVITTGGTITPIGTATETMRVLTSGATAQRTSVGQTQSDIRTIPAGTYYLLFEQLGMNAATGVYNLEWSEMSES